MKNSLYPERTQKILVQMGTNLENGSNPITDELMNEFKIPLDELMQLSTLAGLAIKGFARMDRKVQIQTILVGSSDDTPLTPEILRGVADYQEMSRLTETLRNLRKE